jgi:RNA polymerase sigma factor (sigma-70 family)
MASAQTNPILRFVRRIAASGGSGDDPDRQLLERFVTNADEGAFQALVERYGPLVLRVCTRVLSSEHDAEDAFQATFLVLVRKAGSIRTPELLGPWLYGVAYRTALKLKAETLKRRQREKPLVDVASPPMADQLIWQDLRPILDEEVNRLPGKYRVPFVLCYMEGKTNEQAAQILGCPRGTVFSRLAWAREQLRRQLRHRGVALSVGALAAFLSPNAGSAAVPASLIVVTSKAALAWAVGTAAAAGNVPAPVAALAEGVLRAMFWTKLKIAVVVLAAASVAGTATGVLTRQALAKGQAGEKKVGAAQPTAKAADKPKTDKENLQGTWMVVAMEEKGEKKAEEEVKDKNAEMFFAGDKVTLPVHWAEDQEAGYKLDPAKKPKQIDFLVGKGKTLKGIYELEGDTWKLCVEMEPDGKRPTEFSTKEGTTHLLVVLKKQK